MQSKHNIKKVFVALLAIILWLAPTTALSQTPGNVPEEPEKNPIETAIEQTSGNTISVEIPEDLLNLILNGRPHTQTQTHKPPVKPKKPKVGKIQGYRVQVFSDGRNPTTLGARARARGNAIVARFPKYRGQVYTFSSSPNWYCRVGNFRTAAEANAALSELKRAFPAYAGEMRTVSCTVIIR